MINLAFSYIPLFIFFIIVFAISFYRKNVSTVDIGWGASFIVLDFSLHYFFGGYKVPFQQVLSWMVLAWGARLTIYLFIRNGLSNHEDFRYKEMMESWGSNPWMVAFGKVYILQSIFTLIVAIPLIIPYFFANQGVPGALMDIVIIGFTIGFVLEALADAQLYLFKRNPENKGKRLKSGVWKLKYPNYYGEMIVWWSIGVGSFAMTQNLFVFIGPVFITVFLFKVSGINYMKKRLEGRS